VPVSFLNFLNGTAMLATPVQTELQKAITYLNAVPAADIVDASLDHTHLYKPESYGFPRHATLGEFQAVHGVNTLNSAGYASSMSGESVGATPDRTDIFPTARPPDDVYPIPGLGQRIEIDRSNIPAQVVEIRAAFDYFTTYDVTVGGSPVYGAGSSSAGYFVLMRYDHFAGTLKEITATRRGIHWGNPGSVAEPEGRPGIGSNSVTTVEMGAQVLIAVAGVQDIFVAYRADGSTIVLPATGQIMIVRRNLVIEIFR